MVKEIVIKILIDEEKDEFGICLDSLGFNSKTPILNSAQIISFLEIAKQDELKKFMGDKGE